MEERATLNNWVPCMDIFRILGIDAAKHFEGRVTESIDLSLSHYILVFDGKASIFMFNKKIFVEFLDKDWLVSYRWYWDGQLEFFKEALCCNFDDDKLAGMNKKLLG